ncbi:MAG: hypothetical protein JNM48_08215 [Rhodospirillales bacterium]|nr:hypothetical protein [Rhodospirillales bacterium]
MTMSRAGALATLTVLMTILPASGRAAEQTLRDTAFVTCAEANALPEEQRRDLSFRIIDAAARHYQTQIPDNRQLGEQIGWLVRSGCTIAPESYFSTVVARAVRVVGSGIEPPLQQPLDMAQAVFLTCSGANALPPDQLKDVGIFIGKEAAGHYRLTPGPQWTPDYIAALVFNGCKMYPDAYYLGMIGRAIRAVSASQ